MEGSTKTRVKKPLGKELAPCWPENQQGLTQIPVNPTFREIWEIWVVLPLEKGFVKEF